MGRLEDQVSLLHAVRDWRYFADVAMVMVDVLRARGVEPAAPMLEDLAQRAPSFLSDSASVLAAVPRHLPGLDMSPVQRVARHANDWASRTVCVCGLPSRRALRSDIDAAQVVVEALRDHLFREMYSGREGMECVRFLDGRYGFVDLDDLRGVGRHWPGPLKIVPPPGSDALPAPAKLAITVDLYHSRDDRRVCACRQAGFDGYVPHPLRDDYPATLWEIAPEDAAECFPSHYKNPLRDPIPVPPAGADPGQSADGSTRQPGPPGPAPANRPGGAPTEIEWQAYRLYTETSLDQTSVAKALEKEHKRPFDQGSVSRMVAKVRAWKGEVKPRKSPRARVHSVDPSHLDLGPRRK